MKKYVFLGAGLVFLMAFFIGRPIAYFYKEHDLISELIKGDINAISAERAALLLSALNGDPDIYATKVLVEKVGWGGYSYQSKIVHFYTWMFLIHSFYSKEERLSFIANYAPMGRGGVGFNNAALALYGRSLGNTSIKEFSQLCIIMKAPLFFDKPDVLSSQADALLAKSGLSR